MNCPLPPFTSEGVLPVGDYPMTFAQLRASHLVTGHGVQLETWDAVWRSRLVDNLEILVIQLWKVGIDRIFINGSFVEEKSRPKDVDGYFECDRRYLLSGRLERDLNALDPHQIWTWDHATRRPHADSTKAELPMWHQYRVELYPHHGQSSGIRDKFGNPLKFPSAFRLSRSDDRPKGIVQIVR